MSSSKRVLKAGILGATGTVGQRFILLLSVHPHFTIHSVGASSRSAGKKYCQATKWRMTSPIAADIKDMIIKECIPELFKDCDVIFSGLDSDVAGDIGFLVTNANCSTTGLVVALKPLQDSFGPIESVIVHTMQAVSGAGYPGVASLDIFDNVVPYISGEEEKMEYETLKILGDLNQEATGFQLLSSMSVSASCNRVPVIDGHTECVSVKFKNRPPPSPEQIIQAFDSYISEAQQIGCYSAPENPILVQNEQDRPQPRFDRDNGNGYSVTV
ncbi:8879_t:CDS:2, partial [Racocetra fulgida]